MLVTLIGPNGLNKIVLPREAIGNYWLCDKSTEKEKKLVNIESRDGNWCIISNYNVKIIDPQCLSITEDKIRIIKERQNILNKTILKNESMYGVTLGNSDEVYILYCSKVYDNETLHLDIKRTKEINIGSGKQNQIRYNNILVSNRHARISYNNGRWMLKNYDVKYGTFVNDIPVLDKERVLLNGDIIYIMGLKIIIMGNSIYVNNPQNQVFFDKNFLVESKIKNEAKVIKQVKEDSDEEIEIYSESEYFSRAPRITNKIEEETVKIDSPPRVQEKEETPAILLIGSSMTMGIMMIISMMNTITGKMNGKSSTGELILTIVSAIAMLISIMLFPILNVKYSKKKKKKYEEKRQKRYREYLNTKKLTIHKIMDKQKEILLKNYVPSEECARIILERDPRLWERKKEDYDFLSLRLGLGDVPLKIDVKYPEEQFAMEDDNLIEMINDIAEDSKYIKKAPVVMSLVEKNISAVIRKKDEELNKFIQNIIIQLIAFQSYEDLKLVFLLQKGNEEVWQFVKMLPYVWDNAKEIRFFSDEYEEIKEISKYLEEELKNRKQSQNADYKQFSPYYLIITDDYKKVENIKIIEEIVNEKIINYGFSLLCITDDLNKLPNGCKAFVSLEEKTGMLFENEISSNSQKKIILETSNTFFFDKISSKVFNIPIRYSKAGTMLLPNSYTFLEMFDVGLIEQLNILDRWRTHDSTLSLKAPIGIDEAGRPIVLDIHEKFHGPHGLIAGSTGSGKSEFIITYILSLAINYHPDDLVFLLIDYKGGGLAGAFEKKGTRLPHLVGTISNIDTNGLQRSLASIQSELKRREVMFNEARNEIDEGTIDIYKYQKLYHRGIVKKPIPHLLIICDEFAELKQQQPEFMDELISVSRIGRSLGVHLILATQKPAGIVNDQIRSNSKFGVCLKVQGREDSYDVIKKPDAAFLKNPGQFYMQVGNDDYFVLGQSAWSGAPYYPSDKTKKKVDNSIQFISNIGETIKIVDDTVQKVVRKEGEQLTNIVKYLHELAEHENIKPSNLWLDNIPETIYVDDLKKKYNIKNSSKLVIGEFDDPNNQKQGIVNIDLSKYVNTLIYGNAESGKETLLSTIIYNVITTYTTQEAQLYIFDFGSEALKVYRKSPHVGDVVFANDEEKINRFFELIQGEIKQRKAILSDYNGEYNAYIKAGKKDMPMLVIIFNNYETFSEIYSMKYEDMFLTITRECVKYGIMFIVTTNACADMRYRLTQNFKQKIALQLNNADDYYNIFEKVGKKRPAHMFGRGLVEIGGDGVYEFQTAKICEDTNYNTRIEEAINNAKQTNEVVAKRIPVMPGRVTYNDVKDELKGISNVPIGIEKKNIKVYSYNFVSNYVTTIISKNMEYAIEYVSYLLEEINNLKNVETLVFDTERAGRVKGRDLKGEFDEIISNSLKTNKHKLCVIISIDKFLNIIGEQDFLQLLNKLKENGGFSFIIIENVTKIKNHQYEGWYKEYISEDSGMYIGNGIDNQYAIAINDRRGLINNCGRSYGYLVKRRNSNIDKTFRYERRGRR